MFIEKENLVRLKRETAFPSRHFATAAVTFEGDGNEVSVDKNLQTIAADFIAFQRSDAFDDRPIRSEISVRRGPSGGP